MSDTQMKEFEGRIKRIEKINRRGGGFEAVGTLGQSFYTRARKRTQRRPLLRSTIVVLMVMVTFKGFLLAANGETAYTAKLEALQEGTAVQKAGSFVMAIDPLTRAVATWVKPIVG
ncbi:hypothetical protein CLV78_106188 [Aliiruegeria haliotis]|uniref:Uncharacterized protein n=1 Tax=Aliiruegeria haliotis TaxID=1280846 RepID=A0A2T0RND5_9RHOB|nr:hypothetical protein [Aliiruegeria haliotis]PRY22647.1 hypothetical protein CLV78_106188 [Aliiruegeria haliotis]